MNNIHQSDTRFTLCVSLHVFPDRLELHMERVLPWISGSYSIVGLSSSPHDTIILLTGFMSSPLCCLSCFPNLVDYPYVKSKRLFERNQLQRDPLAHVAATSIFSLRRYTQLTIDATSHLLLLCWGYYSGCQRQTIVLSQCRVAHVEAIVVLAHFLWTMNRIARRKYTL